MRPEVRLLLLATCSSVRGFLPAGLPASAPLARHACTPLRASRLLVATALEEEPLRILGAEPALAVTALAGVSIVTLASASFIALCIILARFKELKVATVVAELGLLTKAEELGVFSKLESAGAFTLAEKALPIVERLHILALTQKGINLVSPALDVWDEIQATQEMERATKEAAEKQRLAEKPRFLASLSKERLATYSFDKDGRLVKSPVIARARQQEKERLRSVKERR